MKKLFSTLLSFCLVASLGVASMAVAPTVATVTFDAKAKEFQFDGVVMPTEPDETFVPDLFPYFKEMMPGDTRTQEISVSTKNIGKYDTVKLYLQATGKDDVFDALVEEGATLSVKQGETDITESIAEPLLLGSFKKAGSADLLVAFTLPIEAGNEIAGKDAQIDWVFTAEIITNKPHEPEIIWPVTPTPTPSPTATPKRPTVIGAITDLVTPDDPEPTPAATPTPTPEEDITDEKTPTTDDLDEDEIPLMAADGKTAWAFLNLLLMLVTAAVSVVLLVIAIVSKRANKDEDEDEDKQITKRSRITHAILSLVVALVSILLFFWTEDITLPMVFTDKWTLAMVLIALVQLIVVVSSRRKAKADNED